MPLNDVERLDAQRARPRLVELHFALARLKSTLSFMNSGAHPDDETSAMLAALAVRDGIDISFACANRGEGGQNDIGIETSEQLGTLRTAEMEQAASVLGLRHYWLSTHSKDSVFDSSFSKSGEQTLKEWGYERTLQRFVSIVRREQPDILCPTFLDVPGQHGHHRAMTALAHEVVQRAADPRYRVDEASEPVFGASRKHSSSSATAACAMDNKRLACANTPWQIAKLYLPAWGGGGGAYDDELPPPPATLTINADGRDPVTGWSYENIGQHSRRFHRTQGMGRWVESGTERNWPLHLAFTCVQGPDNSLCAGLPANLLQLADYVDNPVLQRLLIDAHELAQLTLDAFPDTASIFKHGFAMLEKIQQARRQLSALEEQEPGSQITHRLARKEQQLARIIFLASGVHACASTQNNWWLPGEYAKLRIEQFVPKTAVTTDALSVDVQVLADAPWQYDTLTGELCLQSDATPDNPYPDTWIEDEPAQPCLQIKLSHNKQVCEFRQAFEQRPVIRPGRSVVVEVSCFLAALLCFGFIVIFGCFTTGMFICFGRLRPTDDRKLLT